MRRARAPPRLCPARPACCPACCPARAFDDDGDLLGVLANAAESINLPGDGDAARAFDDDGEPSLVVCDASSQLLAPSTTRCS